MDRILRDSGGEISLNTYDASGNPVDVDGANAPTIAVTDSAGEAVAGFTPSRTGVGAYKATLPADLEILDVYDATWSWPNGQSRRSQFETVGSLLFTQAELRAFDPVLASETTYPDATLREVREIVTERFAQAAEVSFTLRGRREYLDGSGTDRLILGELELRTVVRIKVDGTALTPDELAEVRAYPFGMIVWDGRSFPAGLRNVEVLYEHGFASVPAPIARAGMRLAKHLLVTSPTDERATAVFTEVGGYRLSVAGRDGPTGLPEVDAVLSQFARRRGGAA